MSDWVCKRCGTICHDFIDTIYEAWNHGGAPSTEVQERVNKLLDERHEIEDRGEMPPLKCQCGEKRVW